VAIALQQSPLQRNIRRERDGVRQFRAILVISPAPSIMTMHARRVAAATALCALSACTVPPLPSQPSGPTPLEIRGTTFMMVGGRGALTAWEFEREQPREVPARWTVEGDAISITPAGGVMARRIGAATVRAEYRDQVGTAIVHVVQSVAGTWRGTITVVDCWQPQPASPDPCADRRGLVAPLTLNVSQSAAAELGNLTGSISAFAPAATGDFVGLFDSGRVFFIQGHVERPQDRLATALSFRWVLEGERLVPLTVNDALDDRIDVSPSVRIGGQIVAFAEIWRISPLTR
jgi:hypothetical protein